MDLEKKLSTCSARTRGLYEILNDQTVMRACTNQLKMEFKTVQAHLEYVYVVLRQSSFCS